MKAWQTNRSLATRDPLRAIPFTRSRAGFTLVELLVVMGIIIILIGLLSPMIARSYRAAERGRANAELASIASALEAYKQDFNSYPAVASNPAWTAPAAGDAPPRPNPPTGAQILCLALMGMAPATDPAPGTARPIQDGVEGPGFRTRRSDGADPLATKAYPPYLAPDRFKTGEADGTTITDATTMGLRYCILDRFRKPILYFPAHGRPNVRLTSSYISSTGMFRAADNRLRDNLNECIKEQSLRLFLGDTNNNGQIDAGESAKFTGDYILWSGGPDENYGPQASDAPPTTGLPDAADVPRCDDLTNFLN